MRQPSPGAMPMLRTLLAVGAIAIVSCSNPFGPLFDGTPYALTRINEQQVPWTSPSGGSITAGWIKLDNDTLAERHEELANGTSSTAAWTRSGRLTSGNSSPKIWSNSRRRCFAR